MIRTDSMGFSISLDLEDAVAVAEFGAHPAQDGRQPGGDARHTLFREETRWPSTELIGP